MKLLLLKPKPIKVKRKIDKMKNINKQIQAANENSIDYLIANNTIKSVILEIKNDRCKIVKILIFRSLSREHFQRTFFVVFIFQYDASYLIICNQAINPT